MGLDMYLKGHRRLGEFYDSKDPARQQAIVEQFPELEQIGQYPTGIDVELGYWRKANAIHRWFVTNVQEGEDDCRTYSVGREQLEELRELCDRVLKFKHLANEQLPTTAGFFFGSTDYDEYYYQDIENTITIIDRVLSLPDCWEFEYHSSW